MASDVVMCPKCGDEMNHHADKLVVPEGDQVDRVDPELGGVVQETHECAECGHVEFREADEPG